MKTQNKTLKRINRILLALTAVTALVAAGMLIKGMRLMIQP